MECDRRPDTFGGRRRRRFGQAACGLALASQIAIFAPQGPHDGAEETRDTAIPVIYISKNAITDIAPEMPFPDLPLIEKRQAVSALGAEDIKAFRDRVEGVQSVEEVQAAATDILAAAGIEAVFDQRFYYNGKWYSASNQVSAGRLPSSSSPAGEYADRMELLLSGLQDVPREMAQLPKTVNFINTPLLGNIGGLYDSRHNSITMAVADKSDPYILPHEFAHAAVYKAHRTTNPPRGKALFGAASMSKRRIPRLAQIPPLSEDVMPEGGVLKPSPGNTALGMGFVSQYATTNNQEMFAETIAAMLQEPDKAEGLNQSSTGRAIRDFALDALSRALPHTGVKQFISNRKQFGVPGERALDKLTGYNPAPFNSMTELSKPDSVIRRVAYVRDGTGSYDILAEQSIKTGTTTTKIANFYNMSEKDQNVILDGVQRGMMAGKNPQEWEIKVLQGGAHCTVKMRASAR